MARLTCQTAGESHGKTLLALVTGLPAGLPVDTDRIDAELARRQGGYGRGGRQRIESDHVEILTGLRMGRTTGSPLTLAIVNRDSRLDDPQRTPPLYRPRPGHADLPGSLKYLTTDCRNILERASARETAARVAAGALARNLLDRFGITCFGLVRAIGPVRTDLAVTADNWAELKARRDDSPVFCPDPAASQDMCQAIRSAKEQGDTLGGIVEAHVFGCPPGLGSCMNWQDKLDGRLAAAVMSIQAFKAVEIGLGFEVARRPGSRVHDPIAFDPDQRSTANLGFVRPTNHAGGLEGGMTNGQPVVVRAAMKPISTLLKPLASVDLNTTDPVEAGYERSDVCAVSAASVIMENVVAFEIASAFCEKFAGDSLQEMTDHYHQFLQAARRLPGSAGIE